MRVCCADLAPAVAEVLPSLRRCGVSALLLFGGCEMDGIVNLSAAVRAASEEGSAPQPEAWHQHPEPALYIYTSGTTGEFSQLSQVCQWGATLAQVYLCVAGLPKAAVINHHRLWLMSFLHAHDRLSSRDVLYICLPLYHSAGFLAGLTGAIERGTASHTPNILENTPQKTLRSSPNAHSGTHPNTHSGTHPNAHSGTHHNAHLGTHPNAHSGTHPNATSGTHPNAH